MSSNSANLHKNLNWLNSFVNEDYIKTLELQLEGHQRDLTEAKINALEAGAEAEKAREEKIKTEQELTMLKGSSTRDMFHESYIKTTGALFGIQNGYMMTRARSGTSAVEKDQVSQSTLQQDDSEQVASLKERISGLEKKVKEMEDKVTENELSMISTLARKEQEMEKALVEKDKEMEKALVEKEKEMEKALAEKEKEMGKSVEDKEADLQKLKQLFDDCCTSLKIEKQKSAQSEEILNVFRKVAVEWKRVESFVAVAPTNISVEMESIDNEVIGDLISIDEVLDEAANEQETTEESIEPGPAKEDAFSSLLENISFDDLEMLSIY